LISRKFPQLLRWCQTAGRSRLQKSFPRSEAGAALKVVLSRRYAGKIVLGT
jgi:hypothetical protein